MPRDDSLRVRLGNGRVPIAAALMIDIAGWSWTLSQPRDVFATSHAYDVLAKLATQAQWAWLLGAVAAIHLLVTFVGGRPVRLAVCAAAALVESAMMVSFGSVFYTGGVTHAGYLLLALWLICKVGDVV